MDPAELLLSVPEWMLDPRVWGAAIIVAVVGLTGWGCLAISAKDPEFIITDSEESYRPQPLTRREGLDKVLAGKWTWDEYVNCFSGAPDDGSLRAEEKRIKLSLGDSVDNNAAPMRWVSFDEAQRYWLPLIHGKWEPILGRADVAAYPPAGGQTVAVDRLRKVDGHLEVWQPVAKGWVRLESYHYNTIPGNATHVIFTEVNGKQL